MNTRSASIPHMPARNPYLTDSVYPISHFNPAATDSVAHAGPTKGRLLTAKDITVIPNLFVSGPTVKKEGDATIVIAPRSDGLPKIDATRDAFELVSFLPYPGLEALSANASPAALDAALAEADAAARAKDEANYAFSRQVSSRIRTVRWMCISDRSRLMESNRTGCQPTRMDDSRRSSASMDRRSRCSTRRGFSRTSNNSN